MRAHVVVALLTAFALIALIALPSLAEDKKKKDPNFDDLFGAPPAKDSGSLDAMKKATEGVTNKAKGSELNAKSHAIDHEAPVQLLNAFAAEVITQDKKVGCMAGGRDKKKIGHWTFDETPAKGTPFEVCLTLASKSGREMNMSVQIVDARNQRVAKAEDVIDFRGRPKIDHVLAYPAPMFKLPGQYFYVVDLDGKEAGRLPLFVVNVEGSTSGAPGSSTGPEPGKDQPVTAKEPDGE